jgi:hypothetical protein
MGEAMAYKAQFGSRKRDYLYAAARVTAYLDGRGNHPICPHCDQPVLETEKWHRVHVGAPRCHGGKSVAVGHALCNLRDNNKVVTPAAAKAKRGRKKHLGIKGPGLGRYPMPCGRLSTRRKTMRGKVVERVSVAQAHAAFLRNHYGFLETETEPQP